MIRFTSLLLLFIVGTSLDNFVTRRRFVVRRILPASAGLLTTTTLLPLASNARIKGAAELDLEFYTKNILFSDRSTQYVGFASRPIEGRNPTCRVNNAMRGTLARDCLMATISACDRRAPGFRDRVEDFRTRAPRLLADFSM